MLNFSTTLDYFFSLFLFFFKALSLQYEKIDKNEL